MLSCDIYRKSVWSEKRVLNFFAAQRMIGVIEMVRASGQPTLHDVAEHAHVSIASVSNYLNGYPFMSDKIKKRIAQSIKELGYVANVQARNLRSGKTRLITLAVPDLTQVYFAELAEEIINVAREYDYRVIVESTGNTRERELEAIHTLGRHMTDGLILSATHMKKQDVAKLEGDFPLVILGERIFNAPAPHVVIENEYASAVVTKHLLDAGCSRIAVIGGTLDNSSPSSRMLRTMGYKNALAERGIAFNSSLIRGCAEWTSAEGARAVRDLYAEGLVPDGIYALNDMLALGVMSQLREMRVKVPEDVRVVGFDNIDEAKYSIPTLTTVDPNKNEIAHESIKAIIQQVESGCRASATRIPVSHTLVYRGSSPKIM